MNVNRGFIDSNEAVVESEGLVNLDHTGHAAGDGPGAGRADGAGRGLGASHGGHGGTRQDTNPSECRSHCDRNETQYVARNQKRNFCFLYINFEMALS